MTKKTKKRAGKRTMTKAERIAQDLRSRRKLCEWTLLDRDKKFGEKHGIMVDLFPEKVTEADKEKVREELAKVISQLGVQSPILEKEISDLQQKALVLWKTDQSNAHELGKLLLQIKALLPHGEFKKWWTKENLSQARVSYCMRLASPKGDKVAAAKKKAKKSHRTVFLHTVTTSFRELYEIARAGDKQRTEELLEQVVAEIRESLFEKMPAEEAKRLDKESVYRFRNDERLKAQAAHA